MKYWLQIQERLYALALKYSVVDEMKEAKLIHLNGEGGLCLPKIVSIVQANGVQLVVLPRHCVLRQPHPGHIR